MQKQTVPGCPVALKGDKKSHALERALRSRLRGVEPQRVAVLCIGNPLCGDDAFGCAVKDAVADVLGERVFDGGQAPENELPRIARLSPKAVLLVDAVDFAAAPGTLRVIEPAGLRQDSFDTHTASLGIASEFLSRECGARVMVLAAQPMQVALGQEMSREVMEASRTAAGALIAVLTRKEP
jgi:hydrogenase 3 maturation protease